MPKPNDRGADLLVTSATQDEKTMRRLLESEGFDDIETEVVTYESQPVEEAAPEAAEDEAPVVQETPATEVEEVPEETKETAQTPSSNEEEKSAVAETPEQAEQRKPRNSRERKIVKLEAQLQEVASERKKDREARENLERELAELKAKLEKPAEAASAKKEEAPAEAKEEEAAKADPVPSGPDPDATELVKPKLADFYEAEDPNEAYLDAISDWRDNEKARKQRLADKAEVARQAEESRKEEDRKRAEEAKKRVETEKEQQAQAAKANEEYAEALKSARERHSDFDTVLAQHGDRQLLSNAMRYAIWTNANPEILYWLGQNPEEAERIAADTNIPEKATQAQVDRIMRKVHRHLDQIDEKIQADSAAAKQDDAAEEDDEDFDDEPEVTEEAPKSASEEKPAAAKTVDPPPQVKAAPAQPEKPAEQPKTTAKQQPAKKFQPVAPVGARGGTTQRSLEELARSSDKKLLTELRDLQLADYRKQRGM